MTQVLFNSALLAWVAGAIAGFGWPGAAARRKTVGFVLAAAGSLLCAAAAAGVLAGGSPPSWNLPCGVPLFAFTVRLTPLSAFFEAALGILGAAVSVYSLGYRGTGLLASFSNILLLGLGLVFAAGDAFFFLVAWELMAVSAWCLMTSSTKSPATRNSAMLFLIMSHAGTGMLLLAFLILAPRRRQPRFRAFPRAGLAASGRRAGGGAAALLRRASG